MKPSKKTQKKLSRCKSVYLVVCYAHWTVREFKWTGKYKKYFGNPWPIVWDYDDHNGTYEEYVKRPIYHTTTGQICTYCFSKSMAEVIAEAMELRMQVKQSVGFKYTIGQEVTFYCNGKGAAIGNVVEQMNYLNKENKVVVGYAIKSAGETYYHIPERNVFPKSVDTGIVLKIIQYRSVSNDG